MTNQKEAPNGGGPTAAAAVMIILSYMYPIGVNTEAKAKAYANPDVPNGTGPTAAGNTRAAACVGVMTNHFGMKAIVKGHRGEAIGCG